MMSVNWDQITKEYLEGTSFRKLARKYHVSHVSIYEYMKQHNINRIEKIVDKEFLSHLLRHHEKKEVCEILGFKSLSTLYKYINEFGLVVVKPKHIEILLVFEKTQNMSKTAVLCDVNISTVRRVVRTSI